MTQSFENQLPQVRRQMLPLWLLSAFLLIAVTGFLNGCIKRQLTGAPVTAYEQVMVWNAALAETNDSIAIGLIQVSPQFIPADKAAVILRGQKQIAQLDEELSLLLKQGPVAAKLNAAEVKGLVDRIQAAATAVINSGAIGVKNPKSQQTFDGDIAAIANLIQNINGGLKQAGVIQ